MSGSGIPEAAHVNCTGPPASAIVSSGGVVMVGGTRRRRGKDNHHMEKDVTSYKFCSTIIPSSPLS